MVYSDPGIPGVIVLLLAATEHAPGIERARSHPTFLEERTAMKVCLMLEFVTPTFVRVSGREKSFVFSVLYGDVS